MDWFCEHAGLARVYGGDEVYGDAYCYALPFVVRERFNPPDKFGRLGLIEYVGVTKIMSPCQCRALYKAIREAKYGLLSSRMVDGKLVTRECGYNTWQPPRE